MTDQNRCENTERKARKGHSIERCTRMATTSIRRNRWIMTEMRMQEQEMQTCRQCAGKRTTGRQQEPDWPWRWPEGSW